MDLELIASAGRAPAGAPPAAKSVAPADHAYACPMHPEVSAKVKGTCPVCKMDLEPIAKAAPTPAPAMTPIEPRYASGVLWLPETFPPREPGHPRDGPPIGAVQRRVFVDDVRAAAWLETPVRLAAVLYRDELIGLAAGAGGAFFRSAAPRGAIEVRLSGEPPVPWDGSTVLVRFLVVPPKAGRAGGDQAVSSQAALRSGDVGWLELPDTSRELLVFPRSALLRSGNGPYVLVPGADAHTFARRPVEIGRILDHHVVVLSGVREGERLVVGKTFFLDAQAELESEQPVAEVSR
jgi:hypothetical protein